MIKRPGLATAFAILFCVFLSTSAPAQERLLERRAPDGWGPGSRYGRMYDLKSVETISGKVLSVGTFKPREGEYYGVHVQLASVKETLSVHLGPGWFITNQDFKLNPGDMVEVTGSRIVYEGKPAIIASRLRKDEKELLLRDENGIPYWHAYRRRPAK